MNKERLGLIAGEGALPEILAKRLIDKGILPFILVLQGSRERFHFYNGIVCESAPGKVNNIINFIKKNDIGKIIIIGSIDKRAFLERKGFDIKALQLIKKMKNGNDTSIFNLVQSELNAAGVEILRQDLYLGDMIAGKGIITRKKPSKTEMNDAEYGIEYAKSIASMDIGQTIVVKNKTITAVEAVEGTSEAIKRGGILGKNKSVVCKAARSNQNPRFDIPVIGPDTIKIMKDYNCSTIALEADKIFIINTQDVVDYADSQKISIIGL